MTDPSLSDSATNPDQSTVASEQAQPLTHTNVAGSAMLDAQAAARDNQPQGDPIEAPIATNFSKATAAGDAQTAGVDVSMESSIQEESSSQKGSINLQNNPDAPGAEGQGNVPDTDSMSLPSDQGTNLPS